MGLFKKIIKRVELESRLAIPIARKMPEFLIIGAQKGGTTSLYDYLIQHPQIISAFRKEIHYFDKNYEKGMNWYNSFFPLIEKKGISGEASPFYLYHKLVPQRIKSDLNNVRLIVLLRDPVQRAFSHYKMEKRRGIEKFSFVDALEAEETRLKLGEEKLESGLYSYNHQYFSYLDRGNYAVQLQRWFEYFDKDNILILNSESFFKDPGAIYNQVLTFLGLKSHNKVHFTPLNTDKTKKKMSKDAEQYLKEYFKLKNQELYDLLGEEYSW